VNAPRKRSMPGGEPGVLSQSWQIPKTVPRAHPTPPARSQQSPRFQTFESLIKMFGEFMLITDASVRIASVWNSQRPARRLDTHRLLGCRLSAIIHPRLLREIEALARRTDALGQREERELHVEENGSSRWFSVCAIPLRHFGEEGFAACLVARDVTHRRLAAEFLAERGELLARAERLANFGSWEMDLKTGEVTLSPQLMKMFDVNSQTEWSAQTYWDRMHPGDRERVRCLAEQCLISGTPCKFTARYCAPDGRVRVHLAHTLPLFGDGGKPYRVIGVIQDVTGREHSRRDLRRLTQQLMNQQDKQRRHLARELHESAGQSLAALKMTLGRLRQQLPGSDGIASSLLESAVLLADGAIREVRTVSYLLHPPLLDDAGLGPTLRWYARGFSERSGIRTIVRSAEPFGRYSQEIETTVFRVVQEALTNVHRYSGSATAEIRIAQQDSQLLVEIRDHGRSLASPKGKPRRRAELGVGISGMRERVRQLDGTFELHSALGHGTTVRALLPASPLKPVSKNARMVKRSQATRRT
jgi:signal transduction histidine kinase